MTSKTKAQPNAELEGLHDQLKEMEAIRRDQIEPDSGFLDREAALGAILNGANESALLVDPEGTILEANEVAAQRLGKGVNELIGLSMSEYLPPELVGARKSQGDKVVQSGRPVRFQDERAGQVFDITLNPVIDADGKVKAIAIYANDITAHK